MDRDDRANRGFPLRVAQEVVTNATKHADGQPTTIALEYTNVGVQLRVENALPDARAIDHPYTAADTVLPECTSGCD